MIISLGEPALLRNIISLVPIKKKRAETGFCEQRAPRERGVRGRVKAQDQAPGGLRNRIEAAAAAFQTLRNRITPPDSCFLNG